MDNFEKFLNQEIKEEEKYNSLPYSHDNDVTIDEAREEGFQLGTHCGRLWAEKNILKKYLELKGNQLNEA